MHQGPRLLPKESMMAHASTSPLVHWSIGQKIVTNLKQARPRLIAQPSLFAQQSRPMLDLIYLDFISTYMAAHNGNNELVTAFSILPSPGQQRRRSSLSGLENTNAFGQSARHVPVPRFVRFSQTHRGAHQGQLRRFRWCRFLSGIWEDLGTPAERCRQGHRARETHRKRS